MWSTDLNLEIPFAIKNTLATAYLTMKRYSLVKSVVMYVMSSDNTALDLLH
jgi:hypothetical protein